MATIKCPNCKYGYVQTVDHRDFYARMCTNGCGHREFYYEKKDFLKTFECPNCGGLSGKIEENALKLGVRCNNCGQLTIMINKEELDLDANVPVNEEKYKMINPHCGSTAGFTPVRRKWSILTGFATNKVDMICNNCGKAK